MRKRLTVPKEDKTPRKVGHIPVNLGIEKVPEAYEHSRKAHRDTEMVENPEKIEIVFLPVMMGEPPHRQYQGDCPSVTCKPAFPRHEYLPEAFPAAEIIVRLIEDAVPEPCSDDSTYKKGIQQRVEELQRNAFPLEEPFEYEPSENEPGYEQYGIPPDGDGSYMEYFRIDIPVYKQKIKHCLSAVYIYIHLRCTTAEPHHVH